MILLTIADKVVRRPQRDVRYVHVSVNGSFCSVLAKQVFPLTSELRGAIGMKRLAVRERERER